MSTQITMKIAIRKMGNSRGIIIPRPLLLQAGLEREAEMTIEKGSIVLRRPPSEPRIGWAAASLDPVDGIRERDGCRYRMVVSRGDVWLVALDPTQGSEIRKARPCVVVSPPEMNAHLRTVIAAPMTTGSVPAPFRVPVSFTGKRGLILLDQVRTLDKTRLVKRLGKVSAPILVESLAVLREVFAE